MWLNRPTLNRNYSGEQKVNFESPVPFSKCLRAKIYCAMNVHFDPQGCHTLLLKESELFLLSLGSWTRSRYRVFSTLHYFQCIGNQLLQLCTAHSAWSDSVIRSASSDSVIKLVWVLFGKCTTLVVLFGKCSTLVVIKC